MNNLSETAIVFLENINNNEENIKLDSTNTNWLLEPLKHLSRPTGMTLGMYYVGNSHGGNTEVYFHEENAIETYQWGQPYTTDKIIISPVEGRKVYRMRMIHEPFPVLNYIHVNKNPEAIWEAYLLYEVGAFLPLFWHAGYCRFQFIFSKEDLIRVHDFTEEELYTITSENSFDPIVEHKTPSILFPEHWLITYYKWTEWGGLYKKNIIVHLGRGGSIYFFEKSTNVFNYNCRIMY